MGAFAIYVITKKPRAIYAIGETRFSFGQGRERHHSLTESRADTQPS